jgi:hypothetical protein
MKHVINLIIGIRLVYSFSLTSGEKDQGPLLELTSAHQNDHKQEAPSPHIMNDTKIQALLRAEEWQKCADDVKCSCAHMCCLLCICSPVLCQAWGEYEQKRFSKECQRKATLKKNLLALGWKE